MKNRAFTLIELLVVVLIIGILSAIALPQYKKAVWKSRFATVKALTKSIADAEEIYYLANNKYTTDWEELDMQGPAVKESSVSSTYGNYHYDWGYCQIENLTDTVYKVACRLKNGDDDLMGYTQYLKHSPRYTGEIHCVSYNSSSNTIQYQLCKQESGQAEPTESNSKHHYDTWKYVN